MLLVFEFAETLLAHPAMLAAQDALARLAI